ncbi:cupin-like domain-containing protein [Gilvimarinus polysaccharolyticus]|uniref:cupin-like domain-containing protein n=1 Tax=Gilvimarinus polysaccharolyticus TaxID=863921 RepID=UPI00067340CA|nr:cupin-like domain-containing protein [Gilvimarinus polysaccharolyticus]
MSISERCIKQQSQVAPNDVLSRIGEGNAPILFKGLVAHWPVVQRAKQSDDSFCEYLASFYKGSPVTYYKTGYEQEGRFFYTDDAQAMNFSSARESLLTILECVLTSKESDQPDTYYVGSTTVERCLPGFSADNDLPLSNVNPLASIWLGNRSRIAAHFDSPDNLACCIAGQRRFTLFPPEQLKNLYLGPLQPTPSGQVVSMVDFKRPDFEIFPNFKAAQDASYVIDLNPGDALFIPAMWWHHVESLAPVNGLVNYWWRDDKPFMDSPMDALCHAILAIRDLPKKEKSAWQEIFNHYIFSEQDNKYDHIPEAARGFLNALDEIEARKLRAWLLGRLKR